MSKSILCAMCVAFLGASSAHAEFEDRTILLLLKNLPGGPAPVDIVNYANAWPHAANRPLQAFDIKDPEASGFLMEDRATGDFLAWLQANPNSARSKLEDSVLILFSSPDDIPEALAALQADPYVDTASLPLDLSFHTAAATDVGIDTASQALGTQYGWDDMDLAAAWQITGGGYAQIAHVDMGVAANHPALRAFAGNSYVGGNLMLIASKDVGLTGQPAQPGFHEDDVDEGKAMFIPASPCTPIDAALPPDRLGHGTHAAGLLGANESSGVGVRGACKHCGIAEYRSVYLQCIPGPPALVAPKLNFSAADRAKAEAVDTGAQVLSLSFGIHNPSFAHNCLGSERQQPMCLTIEYAASRDAAMVASSGNQRIDLDFPASDSRVVSAGGFQPDLSLWDESPGTSANCPPPPGHAECGSNYSWLYNGIYRTHQELLGASKHVLSTAYPNSLWVDYAECGDAYGTPTGDGVGWCTGTSMAAPQIAGVIGLLRSVNPLVPIGTPGPPIGTARGVRAVLAETGSRTALGQAWSPRDGYGIPDVAAAAQRMLGKVAGSDVRNRATPLFRLYSTYAKDFAETTSPQYALSLMIAQVHDYVQPNAGPGAAPIVPGYAFPYDADDPNDASDSFDSTLPPAPRAAIYVLTTNVKPRGEWAALVPLYLMEKPKASGRDHLLVTTTADIEAAHAGGYSVRTLQGYVYGSCAPEPECVPPGAQALYRACNTGNADCAIFLESERAAFEANGYIAAFPAGGAKKIGYAYPAADGDGDGLPDGFEEVIGTSSAMSDSDLDGKPDAAEFPLAGVPLSDPCAGGAGAMHCPADSIFADGFDGY